MYLLRRHPPPARRNLQRRVESGKGNAWTRPTSVKPTTWSVAPAAATVKVLAAVNQVRLQLAETPASEWSVVSRHAERRTGRSRFVWGGGGRDMRPRRNRFPAEESSPRSWLGCLCTTIHPKILDRLHPLCVMILIGLALPVVYGTSLRRRIQIPHKNHGRFSLTQNGPRGLA